MIPGKPSKVRVALTQPACVVAALVAAACLAWARVPGPAAVLAPATVAPATVAPATVAPATVAPSTIAPATVAPATVAPATVAPATIGQPAAVAAVVPAVDFGRDVRPILSDHCFACHGPDDAARKAKLRLDTAAGLAADLGGYRVTVPGDPEESELFLRVTADDAADLMPPPKHGKRLDATQIETLRRWIEAGAQWQPHWAYAPARAVEPPTVRDDSFVRNGIDRFVLARLERDGIRPAPAAGKSTLLRRVSLDLIGMVPTLDELEQFLADEGDEAYERAVDRLLASPHYAERWARHWLDLARYADSHGFTIDGHRSMWPYRDWVIDAIDRDLPYDRFTIEQLAGDLLDAPTNAQLVATGFHRNTQINQEGGAKDEENRINAVIDRVNTTGSVWLGSTLACAQCHTHKYDPVTQTEYFQFFDFFNHTEDGGITTAPSIRVAAAETAEELAVFEAERARLRREVEQVERAAGEAFEVFRPTAARGSNGPQLRLEADGSLRSLGQNPQTSVYELDGVAPAGGFAAVRLEALPHPSLPHRGPGRAANGNFVLQRVRVLARSRGGDDDGGADAGRAYRELPLARAEASYSQPSSGEGRPAYPVSDAIRDGGGWAIQPRFGEPHVAVFHLAEPLPAGDHDVRIELHQEYGSNHVLGRFRIALGGQATSRAEVTDEWRRAWTAWADHEKRAPALPTSLVMRERGTRRATHLFRRGSFLDPGERVEAGFPSAMNHFDRERIPRSRLDLARWLVDPRNALVHRVTVNRWWQQFFGVGIVETENDFGIRGAEPSHPDLLEWLAGRFVRSGFSRKAMHRLIVLSGTYRQASAPRPDLRERDPRNRLLARQSRLRVDAECIRDSALRAAGLLSTEIGGAPVQPPQPDGVFAFTQTRKKWRASEGSARFRRTLYTRIWRSSMFPFLTTFDAPVASHSCTRRGRSNTALQALTLANDPMMIEIATGLAARVVRESPSADGRLERLFLLCLSRRPTLEERRILEDHLAAQQQRHAGGASGNAGSAGSAGSAGEAGEAGEAGGAGGAGSAVESAVELRIWTAMARVVINLDEFLTRE